MRILVTGASGLLGINLALEATKQHTVFGLVNHQQLNPERIPFREHFNIIQADLLEPGAIERVLDQTQPDWVINCAAMAIVDACEIEPDRAWKLNREVPAKLSALLAGDVSKGGARLLHISTDAVFDGRTGNYKEEDEPHPLSVYANTKLHGEQVVLQTYPNALVARVNMFGWSLNQMRALSEFFYYNLSAGKQIKGFTDIYFCPLLANDLAGLLLQMLEKGLAGLYHVVSRECVSKYEFGVRLARKFGLDETLISPVSFQSAGLKAERSPHLTLDTAKLAHALGKQPPSVYEGLQRLWELDQEGYRNLLWDIKS